MIDKQLNEIESALSVTLPVAYRQVSRASPFRPIGRDWVYCFYDDPKAIINEPRFPMEDGGYSGPVLLPRYVVIVQSAGGDGYLLDTTADGAPVACLSHEIHAVEPGWATFEVFVEGWLRLPAEVGRSQAAGQAAMQDWWQRAWLIFGALVLFAFVLPLLMQLLAQLR